MFLFADDEYRAGRCAHNTLSRTADTKVPPTSVAVGGDDDQINVKILGGPDDLVRRMPDANK